MPRASHSSGRLLLTLSALLGLFTCLGSPVYADGWLHIRPPYPLPYTPRPHYLSGGMEVVKHHVAVTIVDESVEVTVSEVFRNPHARVLEGVYYFPVPAQAAVDDFQVTLGGKRLSGEILGRDDARKIYEQLVRRTQDPALLEYYDRQLFRARVYPIPARGDVAVSIRYRHTLSSNAGTTRFEYPLDTGRFSGGPYKDVSIVVDASTTAGLETISSPSHPVHVQRLGPSRATLRYVAAEDAARRDFVVTFATAQSGLTGGVRTYRESKEDGFFLLRIAPGDQTPQQRSPNTVVFVVDTSGSMAGEKILHTKGALDHALRRLRPEDSFQIVTFAARVRSFRDAPVLATAENVASARTFVQSLTARGGTNLDGAVRAGITAAQAHDNAVLLLLSDGAPTVGVIDPKQIVAQSLSMNRGDTRLHVLGLGHDVNTILLDDLSRKNRGSQSYVEHGSELEVVVSAALDKALFPCVTDLSVTGKGIVLRDLEPQGPYDLFFGEDLVVTGRYHGQGEAEIVCTGEQGGAQRTLVFTGAFVRHGGARDVPYLWAQSRILRLLDELRSAGISAQPGLRDQISSLGLRFGIVTPYTSFLVTEDASPQASQLRRRLEDTPELDQEAQGAARGFDRDSGASSFGYSQAQSKRKKALIVGRVAEAEKEDAWRERLDIQRWGGRAFFPVQGRYVDGSIQDKQLPAPTKTLHMASEEFWEFLRNNPGAAPILAAGVELLFAWDGEVIEVLLTPAPDQLLPSGQQDPGASPPEAPKPKAPRRERF